MSKRLYLIRHGHTVWNGPPHRIQGQMQSDLSEAGRAATRALGRQLSLPDRIISSPAERCLQTVDCLFGREPDALEPRLLEINLGWFCGLLATEVEERDPDAWYGWRHTPARLRPGDGETLEELQARVVQAMQEIVAGTRPDERLFIATHGGCLRTLICYDRDAPLDIYPDIAMENLTLLRFEGDALTRGGLGLRRIRPDEVV
ncbi:MAG TPA: histidine phosphatase family protein [Alphaproteobacteria bacterium]|jgi:broad specificity phosphatase PhoE|nr:histidine phosphatase family protein [Alphaproteobacteria bacterium]